ncbi:uncharacterized protein NPIL_186181 [Nephila pilipes]|uniref:Uncharacterized protein n=1 Tax=Nephila pilipes TaxID=299642 RepID=A0A8X6MNI3_NEPPI|nr:uncharacterized protein NPIL_186181 [Nephila pilipes]
MGLRMPPKILVTCGEKLKVLLGLIQRNFFQNPHKVNFYVPNCITRITFGGFEDRSLATTRKNLGLRRRFERVKEIKTFDMCGMLDIDLVIQPRFLLSGITNRVCLLKAKDELSLLARSGAFRLQIENISIFTRKCDASSSIVVGMKKP